MLRCRSESRAGRSDLTLRHWNSTSRSARPRRPSRSTVMRRDEEAVDAAVRDGEAKLVADEAAAGGARIPGPGARIPRQATAVLARLLRMPGELRGFSPASAGASSASRRLTKLRARSYRRYVATGRRLMRASIPKCSSCIRRIGIDALTGELGVGILPEAGMSPGVRMLPCDDTRAVGARHLCLPGIRMDQIGRGGFGRLFR